MKKNSREFSRNENLAGLCVMVVDMKVVYTFNQSDHISKMRVDVDDIVDGKHNWEEKTREIADIRM